MFTFYDRILKRAGGLFTALCAAMAFCAGSAIDVRAQPAPPNDNLASAQGIIGSSGSALGTNLFATAQLLEPMASPGNPPQASIWYVWTAPITATIDFNTRGSTDTNGNELDTVLAIYKLKSGTNVAFTNLTQLATNDDDPSGGVTSRVDFSATLGTMYLIQVDGSQKDTPGTNAQGIVVLNWGPSLVAGTFGFSTSTYLAGQFDDGFLVQPPGSISPSIYGHAQGASNIRITVSRTGAFTGRCAVTFAATNGFYTNTYETNYTGTNIYITNYGGNGQVIGFTNIFFTNVASQNFIADVVNGAIVYLPAIALYQVWQTNENVNNFGDNFGFPVIKYPSLGGLGLQDFFTNFYCEPFSPQPAIVGPILITNATSTNVVWTNVFCYTYITNVLTPSAEDGVDYQSLTTNLIFDDFQMSKDVYLTVNPSFGPDFPDANGDYTYIGINAKVLLSLTNALLDPYEDPDIVPPIVSTNLAPSELDILSLFSDPNNFGGNLHTNQSIFGNIDASGNFSGGFVTINWERTTFRVNKNTGDAYIWAVLEGNPTVGATYAVSYTIDSDSYTLRVFDWNRFPTVANSDYAIPPVNGQTFHDFEEPVSSQIATWGGVTGVITIGPFPVFPATAIEIPIDNNATTEFDSDIYVQLFETGAQASANAQQTPPGYLGNIVNANVTINYGGNAPGGSVDTSYNPDNSIASHPVLNPVPGANETVQALAMQPNGQAVIGGSFTAFDATPIYGVVRLLSTGLQDPTFNPSPGTGINYLGFVSAVAIDGSGRIIIGGNFQSYNGTNAINIARLTSTGALDTTFQSGIGFNGPVWTLAVDANGNILAGGNFTSYNTTNCNRIARLLPNGGLDPSFLPNTGNGSPNYGANRDVESVATDGNGNVLLGGKFTYVNGSNMNYVARLLPSGAVDPAFTPEIGPDNTVYSVAAEPNNGNEILIGGAFQNYNLVSRNSIALLTYAGLLDTSFNPGTGADNTVYSVVLQPDGNILIGGQFENFNSTRRRGVARLLPQGWLDTGFMDTAYNQFAGFTTTYYNAPAETAFALALEPSGNVIIGGAFSRVGGGGARAELHNRLNVARLIGSGPQGPETGGIGNDPGNITLTQSTYTVDDIANKLYVGLDRVNGSLGPAELTLGTNTLPPGPGAASAADFALAGFGIGTAVSYYHDIWDFWNIQPYGSYGWRESDGYYGFNYNLQPPYSDNGVSGLGLTINNDPTALQNLFASLSLLNLNSFGLLTLGGVTIPTLPALGLPSAQLEIINDNFPPGLLGFSVSNYTVVNTSNQVVISVLRTNGSAGFVEVQYYTANGTAISNTAGAINDYVQATGTLDFPPGITSNSFTVTIDNHSTMQPTKFFKLYLWDAALNTGNGFTSYTNAFDTNIPPLITSNAIVTIIDGNFAPGHLSFTAPTASVLKGGSATVSVGRSGGAQGVLKVQCGTGNGTAVSGLNYTGVTNTLIWSNQDISVKTMSIQTLQDGAVDGPETVNVSLFNATNVGNISSNNLILTSPSNAVVTILESDSYGNLNFAVPNFNILQNAGQALITVIRTNGTTGTVSVNFTNFSDTNAVLPYLPAMAGTNFGGTNGTLTFGPGVTSQSFIVPIYYTPDETNAANRIVTLELFNGSPGGITNQFPIFATLTILDNQLVLGTAGSVDTTTLNGTGFNGFVQSLALQPDGSILAGGDFTFFNQFPFDYLARLNADGDYDNSFLYGQAGANGPVQQILSQSPGAGQTNGDIMIVGGFGQVDEINRSGIARLNLNGSLDETFNPGSGADSTIFVMAETFLPAGVANQSATLAYYIGGNFANFDGVPCGGIARLNASTNSPGYQGTVDLNFNVGLGVTSANAAIHALAVQANNQVIAGGDFTSFNGLTYNHLVRLNVDGSVDATFHPSTGSDPTGSVRAIAIQSDGQILIGGLFTNVNGSNYNYLARLNPDGSLDTNFNVGVGGNNAVLTLAIDSQDRILAGGEFTKFSGVTRSGLTRLNPDGTVDPTINFQSGASGGFVDTIVIQGNDEIDIGGGFTSFEGIPENNFARLYGGANSGDGTIQFSQAVYGVLENGTNAIITIQRLGGEGTVNQPTVSVVFSTSDGSAVAGTDYAGVTNTVTFPFGETFETVTIPIFNSELVSGNKTVNLNLSDFTYAGPGNQTTATLIITNVNSAVEFSAQTYRESENVAGGSAIIPVVRVGDPNNTVGITVYTGTNGSATPFVNYIPETNLLIFTPGVMTNYFLVPVLNVTNMFSDQSVDLEMSNPSNAFVGAPSSAILTIASVYVGPGTLAFSQTNYSVSEGATNAVITIVRTNGSSGAVAVTLTTSNGTAIAGINYSNVQTTVNFTDNETNQSIDIPVIQQAVANPNTTVLLTLSNPQGGAVIGGASQEILTIDNDIENFSFTNSPYFVGEGAGTVTLDIVRGGPVTNTASVSYTTVFLGSGNAEPNVDYVPASGVLTFDPNETFTTIPITILQGNIANGPLTFQVNLFDATPTNVQIIAPNPATVTILSDVTAFELSTNSYVVAENGSNIVITVNRLNPNTGAASVQFATSDGTNQDAALNALNQVDYAATNGVLNFLNGQATNSFTVSILNPNIVENNKTFNVSLFNPLVVSRPNPSTNAFLESPSNATVTITNVLTGVSFQSPTYTVSECGVTAAIPVVLSGVTNNLVVVNYSTTNGSGSAGTNYFATNGALTFLPGQTVQTIYVQVINNHIIGPNHTVILTLSGAQGAQLLNPSTAVLTIEECNGAYIVQSGTAFVSGSLSPPGIISPNETVTILFGLRDVAGSNTTALVATLLATNGVVPVPAGESNTYGVLITNGPTVSRPFTFQAVGTNGQNISANLALRDGSQVYSNVDFGFTLGGVAAVFGTNETLLLYGSNNPPSKAHNSNPPNYGYPSVINVAGVVGNLTAVTATLNSFSHTYPKDVAVVLEGPGGQATYLMDAAGNDFPVQNVSLTFSQVAGDPSLPEYTAITNGTYLPTAYSAGLLPATIVGQQPTPVPPYPTSLAGFVGQSPNGTWSLFAADENTLDYGVISNGWSLSISTGIPVEEDSDLELVMTTVPAAATLGSPLVYTISVTNYGPAVATNVIITDALPFGVTFTNNISGWTAGTNGMLTNTVATLAVSNGVTFTVTVIPNALGYITNIAAAVSGNPDPNDNNSQTNIALVSPPSADMGVTLSGSPNPVLDGDNVTYTIVVTNNGPSTATGITAINVLPAGFLPITLTPTQGAATNVNGTITWNVGTLSSVASSSATLTIVAMVSLPGAGLPSSANLDTVTVSSAVYDPAKLNNFAAVKTEVEPAMITVTHSGASYMLSWPAMAGNTILEGSVKLPPTWVPITNSSVVPQVIGGQNYDTFTLPGTNSYHFFRLTSQLP